METSNRTELQPKVTKYEEVDEAFQNQNIDLGSKKGCLKQIDLKQAVVPEKYDARKVTIFPKKLKYIEFV
jgi:hypothetical protein